MYRGGGGIYGNDTEATISKCVIKDSSALEGGGIAAFDGEISNCVVVDNSADYSGGGLANSGVSPTITNCLFNDNSAKYGAAIYCFNYSDAIIENCTISQNVSDALAGGIMADSYSDPLIKNSIVWDNYDAYGIADIDAYNTSAVTADYTDFGVYYEDPCSSGLGTGTGFIQTDPFFANPATNDFHLKSVDGRWDPALKNWVTTDTISSPCIAAGDPCVVSNEPVPNGGRINMGFYGNTDYASKIQPYQVTINLVATDGEPLVDNPEWYIVYESGGYYYYYDSVTRHSGDQVTLAAGTYYALCLDTETNCEAPSVQDSDYVVGSGQPSSYDMEYRAIGYLSVTLTPSTAQWREEIGSGTWRNSGDVVELTAFGSSSSYGVEFKPHLGYDTPAPIGGIFIYRGQQTNRNVYYPDLTRYVSYNSGNNEYDGKTPATAFQTIKYAIHEVDVRGGGFLYFAGEHYTETLQASDFNDLNYLTKCRTTAPSVLIAALQSVFPPGNVNFSGPFYFDQ